MAAGEEKSNDFYAVLGLKKECTASELRNAYKRLALMWHPDRCSSSGNSKFVEEAKKKFQAIQEAYSVLSDANKRFLYDVGAYDSDDDESGMGDFLNEMAVMMNQTKSNENGKESFEELQELFEDMFQRDVDAFDSASHHPMNSFPSSTSTSSYCESSNANNKRNSAEMGSGRMMSAGESSAFDAHFQSFCFGVCVNGEDRRHAREISGGGKEQEEEFQEEPTVDEEERVESKRFHLAMMSPPMTTTLMFILNYAIISFHGQPSGISWGNHIETAEAAAILAMANRELRSRELLLWTSGSTHLLLQPILPLPLCSPFLLVPASIFKKMMLPLSAFSFWLLAFGFWM